jgi:hypothetical protein
MRKLVLAALLAAVVLPAWAANESLDGERRMVCRVMGALEVCQMEKLTEPPKEVICYPIKHMQVCELKPRRDSND